MANINSVLDVINKVVPDKDLQDQLKVELVKALNDGTVKMEELSVEKSKIDAKIRLAVIERFSIPAVIYTFLFLLIHNIVIAPYVELIFKINLPSLIIPSEIYDLITWITVGVMGKKSVDSITKRG